MASFSASRIFGLVIRRVGLLDRLPDDFLAEDGLAIHDGRHLQVGRAEVEADPTAVEMTPEGLPGLAGRRHDLRGAGRHLEGLPVHLLAHEVVVELAVAVGGIHAPDVLTHRGRAADEHAPSSACPEQELDQPLGIHSSWRPRADGHPGNATVS